MMSASAADSETGSPPPLPSPEQLIGQLRRLLDLEDIDTDLYRGPRQPGGRGRVFGGQVIAQALVAATRSVDPEKRAHSLHAYFMRPGNEDFPIIYQVVRDFDGRSFATRRVIATQNGQPILNMAASFQLSEAGLEHQLEMPDVPGPGVLVTQREFLREHGAAILPERMMQWLTRPRPIEIRPVNPGQLLRPAKCPPFQSSWFRAVAAIGDEPALHRAILAFASDMALLGTCTLPHGVSWLTHDLQTASLDHAIWFHGPFQAVEWLLYSTDSPWSGSSRGFNRGQIFTRDGRLVASVAQEGLVRLRS
jgi:acyl-CoA thioesterase-2